MYYRLKQLTILTGDLLMLYTGLYLAVFLRNSTTTTSTAPLLSPMSILFFIAIIIIFIIGLYDLGRAKNNFIFYQKIITTAIIWTVLGVIFFYTNPSVGATPKTILLLTSICSFGLLAFWRYIYNTFLSTHILKTRILFAGYLPEINDLIELFERQPQRGYNILGFLKSNDSSLPKTISFPQKNTITEIVAANNGQHPDIIVVAPALINDPTLNNELYRALFSQISIVGLDEFYESVFLRVPPFIFSETWFTTNLKEQQKKIYDRFRLFVDFGSALIMGSIFIITFPLIALIIKINSSGPVLFTQIRVGRGGKKFSIYKYRTMHSLTTSGSAEINGPQFAKEKDARITKVGSFLRKTHLDELPQFINILKGEMSLVGPRPERPEFVEELNLIMPFYSLRHLIKPGITGWAQLQKSYYGNMSENLLKLQYDLYYVKNRGPIIDLSIMLKTINELFKMAGR